MPLSIEQRREIHDITYKLMTDMGNRNIAFDAYMSMYKSGWDLPPEVRSVQWIQKVINSDPYDAVQTGMRILATIPMSIRYQPLLPGIENEKQASITERVLKWQYRNSNRRRSRSIEAEMAKQALLFELCAMKVVDWEWEMERRKGFGGDTKRVEAALKLGRIGYVPYDARSVFPLWSNLMLEGVLIVQHRRAHEVVKEWGAKAEQYPDLVKLTTANYGRDWVTYYEWQDFQHKMTWVRRGMEWVYPASYGENEHWVLDDGKSPTPFIPWAILGGSELETDPVHKHQPLLYPVYATGAWDIKNIVQTLGVSEVIAHTGSPRLVEEGPNKQQGVVNYGEPERVAKMPAGNTLKPIPPPQLDQALANVEALLSAQIDKATVARVLQGGELPAGTAFATLNLATQTAVGVLSPFKDLTQKVLALGSELTLRWVAFTGKDLMGYGSSRDDNGQQYVIKADEVSEEDIYIDVELHPDTATDKQQKVNTAAIAVQQLGMSLETALDEIGIEDPQGEIKRGMWEKMAQHELDMEFQRDVLELQNEMSIAQQAELLKMQFEMQSAMAEQQGAQQPPPGAQGGQMGGQELPPPEQGGELGGGLGANPAAGAFPPAGFGPAGAAEGAGNPNQQISEEGAF